MVTIALVDDHHLVIHAFKEMIHKRDKEFSVIINAFNGKEFITQLQSNALPSIVFMDIRMPIMDGISATQYVCKNFPTVKVIGLSAFYNADIVTKMKNAGAVGFITKDINPKTFWEAIDTVCKNNTFFNIESPTHPIKNKPELFISEREKEFLKLCATELTYKEIAVRMNVKNRTVENYTRSLFEKLNTVSRTGLSLYAVKNGLLEE